MELPYEYIVNKIYTHAKRPIRQRYNRSINFECPICKEGSSAGKKRRGYFFEDKSYFFCHNCNTSWSPVKWIQEVSRLSYREIMAEAEEYSGSLDDVIRTSTRMADVGKRQSNTIATLPKDCINLADPTQVDFYKSDSTVQAGLNYIAARRLDTAVNRARTYYVTLVDDSFTDRLIIPFLDETGQIIYYQGRDITGTSDIRYKSKPGDKASVFGIDRIDPSLSHIFIFEGPIDSMFIRNGVAVCGIRLTERQQQQLDCFRLYQKVWVLDNQLDNDHVYKRYEELINDGETVMFWPDSYREFKDLNAVCVKYGVDQVSPEFILKNSYKGMAAEMKLRLSKSI